MNTLSELKEQVNHPTYYNRGTIEVSDFIVQHKLDFLIGNVVKYICRAGFKDNELKDLMKSRWYLNKAIECGVKPPEINKDAVNPGVFAIDQMLEPSRTSILVNVVFGNLDDALILLDNLINTFSNDKKEPKVYGRDEKRLNDTRVVNHEFGNLKKGCY